MVRVYEYQPGCEPSDVGARSHTFKALGVVEYREVYVRADNGNFVVVWRSV